MVLLTKSVGFLTIQFKVKMITNVSKKKVPRDDFIFEKGEKKETTEVNSKSMMWEDKVFS